MDLNDFKLFPLPSGWININLVQISKRINPGFPSGKHNKAKLGIPHLRPMNISDKGEIDLSNLKYVEVEEYESLLIGDVLFNNTNSPKWVGKTAYIKKDTNWAYSNHMTRIRLFINYIKPAWVSYLLHFYFYRGFFKQNCTHHVNQASINSSFLSEKVSLPLPPLPEQHGIVEKIEELFTKLDAGVDALQKIKQQLKRYRQSVLKHAFEGKLTAEWREKHKEELEPASVLLEKIKEDRANSRAGLKKKDKKYKELPAVDTNNLPKLQEGWEWEQLQIISDVLSGYAFKSSKYSKSGYQIVKIGNVKMTKLDLNEKPTFIKLNNQEIINKYLLKINDILISMTGTRRKRDYGNVAIVMEEENLLVNQRVARIRFSNQLCAKYFLIAMQSDHFRDQFFKNETGNVGQGNVGINSIKESIVPVPGFDEQIKIVEEIERHFSIIEKIEKTVEAGIKQSERLRQSILKKAFEGKLVPQDPSDEPASVLLERIKAEKAKGNK